MFKNIISAFLVMFAVSTSFAMVNSGGQPVPGFYTINDEEDALTMIQVFEGNHIRIYDRRPSDHVILVEGTFSLKARPDFADYLFEVKVAKQRSMDGTGEVTDFSAKESPFRSVKISYSTGIMYNHAKISYVHRDGHTSSDNGILKTR